VATDSTPTRRTPIDGGPPLRVGFLQSKAQGVAYYRIQVPAAAASLAGIEVTVSDSLPLLNDASGTPVAAPPMDVDVLVYNLPLSRIGADSVPMLQAQGVAVVVEIDDDYEHVQSSHISAHAFDPEKSPETNWQHLRRAVERADLLTCTTPAIARLYSDTGTPTRIVANYTPGFWLEHASVHQRPRTTPGSGRGVLMGWTGYVGIHPVDLQETGGAVAHVAAETGASFGLVGHPEGVAEALKLPAGSVEGTGWLSLKDYPRAVGLIDVGIVPLATSMFSESKSWLKGLEYATLGVPFVASPTPAYVELHEEYGLGILARTPKDWRRALTRLVTDPDLRLEIAARQQQVVREKLTIEANVGRWIEAWRAAQALRARAAGSAQPSAIPAQQRAAAAV
jgi:hypothetical protein